jgi:orotate phosphoribosyltransferase
MALPSYKVEFLQDTIETGVLKFGSFELKSKRISPYFFNAGDFYCSRLLRALTNAYANVILEATSTRNLEFDCILGLAYKGIILAGVTVYRLGELDEAKYGDLEYSFDRKEKKDHGKAGNIVGAPLKGKRVLIIDDVVTAGTAKREAIDKIWAEGGTVTRIVVALD